MNKRLILGLSLATACLAFSGCGDSSSTKACQKVAYCYKTTDAPDQRKCDLDKVVAEQKAKQAEEAGTLSTPLYEDCWEF